MLSLRCARRVSSGQSYHGAMIRPPASGLSSRWRDGALIFLQAVSERVLARIVANHVESALRVQASA